MSRRLSAAGKKIEGAGRVLRPPRGEIGIGRLQRESIALRTAALIGQRLVHLRGAGRVTLAGERRGLLGGRQPGPAEC